MTFQFNEKPGSRRNGKNPPSLETTYVATGEADSAIVKAYASQAVPQIVATAEGMLFLDDIQAMEQGHKVYHVAARWVTREEQQNRPPVGQFSFRFSTTGGTFHITSAREHIASYAPSGQDAPEHHGAINVTTSGAEHTVEGADIVVPALKLTISFSHPLGVVNLIHARTLARLTGSVNSATFLGFAAGEVIFLGAEGGDGTNSEATIDYHFACEENLEGLTFQNGTITGVSKQGHDLLWVEYRSDKDASDKPVVKVIAAHVERLYRRVDLKAALGFG